MMKSILMSDVHLTESSLEVLERVLMKEPDLVAQCVETMIEKCDIPVTVKHRIGIDDMESYDQLVRFCQPSNQYKRAANTSLCMLEKPG